MHRLLRHGTAGRPGVVGHCVVGHGVVWPVPLGHTSATSAPFTLVAHRGGALVYPESSAEAFEAVGRTAFPIERICGFRDGTLVPLHDDAAERTMAGLSGRPGGITLEQWTAARIRHPQVGAEGTPTTWEAMLDSYGGRNILVPQLKDPAIDPVAFAETIVKRGIQDTVVVQTFSFPAAQALAGSGLEVLYLLRDGEEPDPESISSSGISHVGPHKGVSAGYLSRLKDSGLTVWPYTVNDGATAARLRGRGRMESSQTIHGAGATPGSLPAYRASWRIMSTAFSAIMMVGACVLALTRRGMIEESTTRSPSSPWTFNRGDTTDSSVVPMEQVPTGWYEVRPKERTNFTYSSRVSTRLPSPMCSALVSAAIEDCSMIPRLCCTPAMAISRS